VTSQTLELEGTWEEIMAHAAELSGRRVRLIVLPTASETAPGRSPLSPSNLRMLDLLSEWERSPLTEEERTVLDGLEQHLKEQPFSLRAIGDTL
jgi:hypothetical protein